MPSLQHTADPHPKQDRTCSHYTHRTYQYLRRWDELCLFDPFLMPEFLIQKFAFLDLPYIWNFFVLFRAVTVTIERGFNHLRWSNPSDLQLIGSNRGSEH